MRLFRFAAVWVAIIAVFMIFGGVFGYLMGSAVPQSLTARGGASHETRVEGQPASGAGGSLTVGASSDVSPSRAGASVCAALGMLVGTALGLCISILDQIILAIRRKRDGKPVGGMPAPVAANSPPLRVDAGAVPR